MILYKKNGFTLVEMAIVIVIIGLLITAVNLGVGIVEIARRNAVIADLKKYSQAYTDFLEKYRLPPGNFRQKVLNATAADYCNTNLFISSYVGDNMIGANNGEVPCAWTQLAQAGFIKGSYGGQNISQSPKSPYKDVFYSLVWFEISGNKSISGLDNALTLGKRIGNLAVDPAPANGAYTTTEELSAIDEKIDDGRPLQGRVFGLPGRDQPSANSTGTVKDCITYNVGDLHFYQNATYNANQKDDVCYIAYFTDIPIIQEL